jgi:hypothetical protein
MSRRTVLATATAALVLGGTAAPALAASLTAEPTSTHCVLTHYDPKTGEREGFCVWIPVGKPKDYLP